MSQTDTISPATATDHKEGNHGDEGDPSQSPPRNDGADVASEEQQAESGAGQVAQGRFLSRILNPLRRQNRSSIRDDLSDALAQQDISGDLSPEERAMLNNILRLQDVRVEDHMVPRAEIIAADIRTSLADLMVQFESSGHSRMPVYDETLDDPRGMIHIRDLLGYITKAAAGRKRNARSGQTARLDLARVELDKELGKTNLIRKVLFVPPSMMAADLMTRMQATRIQMALVIDEYGGTEGLISLEDIVEIIVGDIEDEHDDDDDLIRKGENGQMLLDAKAEIDDIREALGGKFHVDDHDEDAETIGGVIFSLLGRVPVKGEVVEAFGYEFRIRDADPRRIKSIEMVPAKNKAGRKNKQV